MKLWCIFFYCRKYKIVLKKIEILIEESRKRWESSLQGRRPCRITETGSRIQPD